MADPILQTIDLTKKYGDFFANTEVSINVMADTIHGVIGPNGAGKTTLFNCLAGTVPLTSGKIRLDGREIGKKPQHVRPLLGMGRSFQVTSLFSDLTVLENLRLASQALQPAKGFVFWKSLPEVSADIDYAHHVLKRIGLDIETSTLAASLSHGQQRLLEVAMALMARPKVLLLDEPTSGMGIDDVPQMIKLLRSLRKECTVVLIEHNIHLVTEVCDIVTVMQLGTVIAEGTPAEISADEAVKTAYLGEDI
ncbi:MAG: ABC transporter ATP-binding protein [Blastopirellula sp.]|nr:MAG: ABC transporter ATP-binding protein [Blastopirellula sp.]